MKTRNFKKSKLLTYLVFLLVIFSVSIINKRTEAQNEVKKWRWEYMYPDDMREALATNPVAWVVFSPLEWHGEAMAFGTDPFIGQAIVDKAWEKVGGVRIPTILIGVETDYKYWGEDGLMSHWGLEQITKEHNYGSLYTRPITFQLVLEDFLYFLKREGFKLVVVSSGHGGREHLDIINEVSKRYEDDEMKVVYLRSGRRALPEELRFSGSGGHADFSEASLLGGVNENMVDKSKFGVTEQDRKVQLLKENVDKIDFEKGRKYIEFRAEGLAETVSDMMKEIKKSE
jgi:creatinine amidohydrolase/Fe(II)-dependent formamide hydrolase-like protein